MAKNTISNMAKHIDTDTSAVYFTGTHVKQLSPEIVWQCEHRTLPGFGHAGCL